MRAATIETRKAVLAFEKGNSSKQELIELIKKCSDKHSQLVCFFNKMVLFWFFFFQFTM
jgi:hypothetical protein